MARQDYMTIAVPKSTQDTFRDFIVAKELTVKEALSDMLDIYMMATDQELYLELKANRLNLEGAKLMVADRDSKATSSDSLFMRLGWSSDNDGHSFNGRDTIGLYIENIKQNGHTWFSTDSLHNGMAKSKVEYYTEIINSGVQLKIYFALNDEKTHNDISYSADVIEIKSNALDRKAPCSETEYPVEFKGEMANIWIDIENLQEETKLTASDMIVVSTGNNLKEVITRGQYIFGYIKKK